MSECARGAESLFTAARGGGDDLGVLLTVQPTGEETTACPCSSRSPTTVAMSDLPLTRSQLRYLICHRILPTRGNLAHHQRTSHGSTPLTKRRCAPSVPPHQAGGGAREPGGGRTDAAAQGGAASGMRGPGFVQNGGDEHGQGGTGAGMHVNGGGVGAGGDVNGAAHVGLADPDLSALLAAAGEAVEMAPPPPKRRRYAGGAAAALLPVGVAEKLTFFMMATRVRAISERFKDAERAKPVVRARKRARPGQFDTPCLRALQDLVYSMGLGQTDQTKVHKFLHLWEQTLPGAAGDDGTSVPLANSFKSPHLFRQALADDIDKAVMDNGWLSCDIEESGITFKACFRDGLRMALSELQAGKNVSL